MISKTLTLTALVAAAGMASAEVVVSYSFTDLDGAWDADNGVFSANATDDGMLSTGGDVSRLNVPTGTATYETGFAALGGFADVSIQMDVTNITGDSADGDGTLVITDADGDTLSASFEGTWAILNPFGFLFFNGSATDYAFDDLGDQDGSFDGTAGSFQISDLTDTLFDGALSILLQNPGGFDSSFSRVTTEADGILIPAPGAIALAGIGLLGMSGVRRRR